MTSTEAYNIIISKANHSINTGGLFVSDCHKLARIYFKRIKEIEKPHESDEALLLRDMLITIATSKTILQTDKRPR